MTKIDDLLDAMDDLFDKAWNLPLTGGKCAVDVEEARNLLEEIRLNLPLEVKQAKAIVKDRNEIVEMAREEAQGIVSRAKDKAAKLVNQEDILKQANTKANELLNQAAVKAREVRQGANEYAQQVLRDTEEVLSTSYNQVKHTRQVLHGNKTGTK
ncbi:ATPase [Candidatus Soleaferrea massiliensis]|uniref:ATPase n=1 Tax=Candidatus Soleaferrea massiliensis TaxID=1470354 RepID=UPI001FA6B875|nr:ATPase [Candidatus Soleaferrea massiliensis]